MDLRLLLALTFGKIISKILKIKGSGATAAPGLYALKIDPNLVSKLTKKNNLQSVVVSGTNGKTTTSRLISNILLTKFKIVHNRQGSNLLRGVASSLIENASLLGKIEANLALWEADEAALLPISRQVNIKSLILLNLFRDQLDRYGEINTTRKKWQEVIKKLPSNSTLILNADDPSINYLGKFTKSNKIYFGLSEQDLDLPTVENVADVKFCINCGTKLTYKKLFSAHLGIYRCTKCDFKRQNLNVSANKIKLGNNFSSEFTIESTKNNHSIKSKLPGLFNIYNVLASVSVSNSFGLEPSTTKKVIENFEPAFGRFEKLKVAGSELKIFLVKNPAGTNEVIRLLASQDNINLLIILNDNIADGRDVSWIWDTNWEILKDKTKTVFATGTRFADMALRLKYANFKLLKSNYNEDISGTLELALNSSSELIILPTYSALLELKTILEKKGVEKWQNQ